jgi:hypothetical protein
MWHIRWFPSFHHHHHRNKHRYHLVFETLINNFKIAIMGAQLNSGQLVIGSLGLVDNVTGNPVQGTFTNVTATSDNSAVYAAVVNADGTITITAVAPGSGNLSFGATAAYTDSNGNAQSQALSGTISVAVAQPAADSVSLVLTLGTPTNAAPAAPAS